MAAAALVPIGVAAARLAAQTGLAYAAGKVINYGLDKGIPKALSKAKQFTAKRKKLQKVSKVIGGIEKAYHSKGGRIVRGGAAAVGSLAAYHYGGKAFDSAGKAVASGINSVRPHFSRHTILGRELSGERVAAAKKLKDAAELKDLSKKRIAGHKATYDKIYHPKAKKKDWFGKKLYKPEQWVDSAAEHIGSSKKEIPNPNIRQQSGYVFGGKRAADIHLPGGVNPNHPEYRYPKTKTEGKVNQLMNLVNESGIREKFAPPKPKKRFKFI